MTKLLKKDATYEDLRDVPDHFVAKMFDGELYASPRPPIRHRTSSLLVSTTTFAGRVAGHHRRLPNGLDDVERVARDSQRDATRSTSSNDIG
jgi:hypothetical protein